MPAMPVALLVMLLVLLHRAAVLTLPVPVPVSMPAPLSVSATPPLAPVTARPVLVSAVLVMAAGRHAAGDEGRLLEQREQPLTGSMNATEAVYPRSRAATRDE